MQLALFDDIEIGIDFLENRSDDELFNLGAASKLGTEILISRGYAFDEIDAEYNKRANKFTLSYERGKRYLDNKPVQGKKPEFGLSLEGIAESEGVSKTTIKDDAQFAKAIDHIDEVSHEFKEEIVSGESGLTKQDILEISKDDTVILEVANTSPEDRKHVHVSANSGNNEWYTPSKFIESARLIMGNIDLDPASCKLANETVMADKYFTMEDNGLECEWCGNIWMNPPYDKTIKDFSKKVKDERANYSQLITLVNNATETGWFNDIASVASAICFPKSRVKFIDIDGNPSGAPLQGQAILYIGDNIDKFIKEFEQYGIICTIQR